MFARVTMGFGVALIAASGLAAIVGAITIGTAIVPAMLGGVFILFGWLDRRIAPPQTGRLQSRSRFPIIGAAVLVFSSARGLTLITDGPAPGATPSGTEAYLILTIVAGVSYIVFGAWSDVMEARRTSRARAAATPVATQPAAAPGVGARRAPAPRASAASRRRTRR